MTWKQLAERITKAIERSPTLAKKHVWIESEESDVISDNVEFHAFEDNPSDTCIHALQTTYRD